MPPRPTDRRALPLPALATAYVVTGWLGLQMPMVGEHITLVWAPAGIALATCHAHGRAAWPWLVAASATLNLLTGSPALAGLLVALGNTVGPALGAHALRVVTPQGLRGVRGTLAFLALGPASLTLTALWGTSVFAVVGELPPDRWAEGVFTWWVGDTLGLLLVGALLLYSEQGALQRLRASGHLGVAAMAWGLAAAVTLLLFLSGQLPAVLVGVLLVPLLALFDQRVVAGGAALSASLVATVVTASGHGPLVGATATETAARVAAWVAVVAIGQHLVATARDELHGREAAQRETDLRLRELLAASADGILLLDSDGRIAFANPAFCDLVHCPTGALFGRRVEAMGFAEPGLLALIATGDAGDRLVCRLGDASDAPIAEVSLTWMTTADGRVRLVDFRDITQRHRAESELRAKEAHLRAMLDAEPECVKLVDRDGRLLDMNPAGLEMIAAPDLDSVRGADLLDIVRPDHHEAFRAGIEAVFAGETLTQVFEIEALDGTRRWMEQRSAPLRDRDDPTQVVAMLAVTREVTERLRREAREARMMRLEALGVMAGGLAHDLGNAINPLAMVVDELSDGPLDPDDLDGVQAGLHHAQAVLKQLLAFARGADGTLQDVHPEQLLDALERMLPSVLPETMRVERSPDRVDVPCRADPNQLHQVLLNLCINARDAMGGQGTLRLRAECTSRPPTAEPSAPAQHLVGIVVEDDGPGMPPEVLDHIFEPFFTTKAPELGTGLGLSSAMGIVTALGGHIEVTSKPGEGARFAVWLPAACDEVAAAG